MKPLVVGLLTLCSLSLSLPAGADLPEHLWSQGFGDPDEQGAFSVAADGSENVIVTGSFEGVVDLGGGPLASAGSSDIFLAKYDAHGNHLWSRAFGDQDPQSAYSIVTDAEENIVITGSFEGTVDLGGGPLTSSGDRDVFIAKYTAAGVHLWSQSFGDARTQEGRCVAIGEQESVILIGSFEGTVDFGGDPLTSTGSFDVFIAKYDSAGAHLWSRGYGDMGLQRGLAIAADGSGDILATGEFGGTIDFGGGALTSAGSFDIFLLKCDPDGAHIWSQAFGDGSSQNAYSICTDTTDRIVIAGSFQGTVDFGGGQLTSAGSADAFVARFDPAGLHIWSGAFGNSTAQVATSVAVKASGALIATGFFWGSVDFGGGELISLGSSDIFAVELDHAGGHVWSRSFGDSAGQEAHGCALDNSLNLVLAGNFEGEVDFGGGALTSAGASDICVAKFSTQVSDVIGTAERHGWNLRAYPNPLRSSGAIIFSLPEEGETCLQIYDLRGRLLRTLWDGPAASGQHALNWDGCAADGSQVAPGILFLRLESDRRVWNRKITVVN